MFACYSGRIMMNKLTDVQALRIALYRMNAAEGTGAVDNLVRECASLAATDGERELVEPLTQLPLVGDMLALEVLARVAWLCNDGKEKP